MSSQTSKITLADMCKILDESNKKPKNNTQKKKGKNKKKESSVHHTYFDDTVVESKPVLSAHAKDRLKQGRQGKYITKRSHNTQVVVTVLPKKYDFDLTMHEIPFAIKHNKKRDFNKELKDFAAVENNYLY